MADQTNRGFRRFMLDPKSSVMTYIADNIPPDHLSHQQGSNGRPQNGPMNNSQQPNIQDPNRLQQNPNLGQIPQNQSQDGFMRPPLPNRPSQSNSPSSSPRPGYAGPVQSSHMPTNTPYIASNISQASEGQNGYPGAQGQIQGSQSMSNSSMAQESMSQEGLQSKYSSVQDTIPSIGTIGQGPPQPGARRRNSPQSAPRLYHRMLLDYEITKQAFFAARSQHNTQEMVSTAYELESSSRRLWSLRYEHSWEFEGYSGAGHQAVYSKWQAEYEMWADTVLDIQDGQILADATNASKYGNTSIRKDADEWDPQSRQGRPGFQDPNGERNHAPAIPQEQMMPQMPQHMPPQQQMPQLQHLSLDQPMPQMQALQDGRPPQPMLPDSFPQGGPPPTFSDQNMQPQQRQQSPQPPQVAMGQSLTPNMQNGPSVPPNQYNGSPILQNAPPPGSTSNTQQHPNMPGPNMQQPNMRPGQTSPPPNRPQGQSRPPQQYPPQNQNMPPNTLPNMSSQQQNMGSNQQQGPPRNGMMSQGPPHTSSHPNASPRPGSQMPAMLQAGGQMSGNGNGDGGGSR